jgi:Mrp family chromosome partitioning ATPase
MARNPMRTLAVASQKDGSGKTTLALRLAVTASQAGLRTILVALIAPVVGIGYCERQ